MLDKVNLVMAHCIQFVVRQISFGQCFCIDYSGLFSVSLAEGLIALSAFWKTVGCSETHEAIGQREYIYSGGQFLQGRPRWLLGLQKYSETKSFQVFFIGRRSQPP